MQTSIIFLNSLYLEEEVAVVAVVMECPAAFPLFQITIRGPDASFLLSSLHTETERQ
jgi:hypothetical protein